MPVNEPCLLWQVVSGCYLESELGTAGGSSELAALRTRKKPSVMVGDWQKGNNTPESTNEFLCKLPRFQVSWAVVSQYF